MGIVKQKMEPKPSRLTNEGRLKKWFERADRFLDRNRFYIRPSLFVIFLVGSAIALSLLFLTIIGTYLLGVAVGPTTVQLLTGVVSAVSAVASASAATLIWRGNVKTRKTVLIDRVLGPSYSETRRSREILESWKEDANETGLNITFLKQAASDWLYYTLDLTLRSKIESFQKLVSALDQQKALAKTQAGSIIREAAKEIFEPQKVNSVLLWRSHTWQESQPTGENGREPIWELVLDSEPLRSPYGYHAHALQIVDTDYQKAKSLPLLSKDKVPINRDSFQKFWGLAQERATKDEAIATFRDTYSRTHDLSKDLEKELDSEIRHQR